MEVMINLIRKKDSWGYSPLGYAVRYQHPESVKKIVDYAKGNPKATTEIFINEKYTFFSAFEGGNQEVMKILLEAVKNNKELLLNLLLYKGLEGRTVLHVAAEKGGLECVKIIINSIKKDKNLIIKLLTTQDKLGWTPMHYAIWVDNKEFIKIIINTFGEDRKALELLFSYETQSGSVLYHTAAQRNRIEIMEMMSEVLSNKETLFTKFKRYIYG